jgi:hypothetical protein
MRRNPVSTSPTIFWPMTKITCAAPDASGTSWLPLAEAMSSDPPDGSGRHGEQW